MVLVTLCSVAGNSQCGDKQLQPCVSLVTCTHILYTHTHHMHAYTHMLTHTHTYTHIHTHRDVLSNTSHLVVVTHHSLLMLNSQTLELLDWKDLRGEYKLAQGGHYHQNYLLRSMLH